MLRLHGVTSGEEQRPARNRQYANCLEKFALCALTEQFRQASLVQKRRKQGQAPVCSTHLQKLPDSSKAYQTQIPPQLSPDQPA